MNFNSPIDHAMPSGSFPHRRDFLPNNGLHPKARILSWISTSTPDRNSRKTEDLVGRIVVLDPESHKSSLTFTATGEYQKTPHSGLRGANSQNRLTIGRAGPLGNALHPLNLPLFPRDPPSQRHYKSERNEGSFGENIPNRRILPSLETASEDSVASFEDPTLASLSEARGPPSMLPAIGKAC